MEAQGLTNGRQEGLGLQNISRDVIPLARKEEEEIKTESEPGFWPQGFKQAPANFFTLKYEEIPHGNIFIVGLLLIFFNPFIWI